MARRGVRSGRGQRPSQTPLQALAGFKGALIFVFVVSGIVNVLALTGIYLVTTGFLYWRTEVERNRVRDAFKHYLSPALV